MKKTLRRDLTEDEQIQKYAEIVVSLTLEILEDQAKAHRKLIGKWQLAKIKKRATIQFINAKTLVLDGVFKIQNQTLDYELDSVYKQLVLNIFVPSKKNPIKLLLNVFEDDEIKLQKIKDYNYEVIEKPLENTGNTFIFKRISNEKINLTC